MSEKETNHQPRDPGPGTVSRGSSADGATTRDAGGKRRRPHKWQPNRPSGATRKISTKSNRSYRGSLPNHPERAELLYESRLERNIWVILMASACFVSLREQPPYVTYVGPDGQPAKHWFDLLGVEPDGTRVAIDVKPLGSSKMPALVAAHRLIEAQIGGAFADKYRILTEEHAHPDDVYDARLILRARRLPDAAADKAVAKIVSTLNGATPIRPLVAATGMKAAAFNALVRLIGEGGACVYDDARISYGAWISRAERT